MGERIVPIVREQDAETRTYERIGASRRQRENNEKSQAWRQTRSRGD